MGQEASIAPKERVNIVYRPATGDAKEEVELPLKVLVMGDFTQRSEGTALEDRAPVNVDKDNFDEVLRAHNLKLQTQVPDQLSGAADAELGLDLEFRSIRDFEPDAIDRRAGTRAHPRPAPQPHAAPAHQRGAGHRGAQRRRPADPGQGPADRSRCHH